MRIQQPITQRLSPYDRMINNIALTLSISNVEPHSLTQRWSYQVPAGQKLFMEHLFLSVRRIAYATAVGPLTISITYTPAGGSEKVIFETRLFSNELYSEKVLSLSNIGTLYAGDFIRCYTEDTSTGGEGNYVAIIRGFTYVA